jgi:hypothetical protein
VLAQAGAKSRTELRDLLAHELQVRAQQVPPAPLLDIQLDHILASASPAGYVTETAKGVKLLGDAVAGLVKIVRESPHERPGEPEGLTSDDSVERRWESLVIGDDNRTVKVQLVPNAESTIAEAGNEGSWPFGGSSHLRRLELRLSADSRVQVLLEDVVGELLDKDAQEFLPLLQAESNVDRRITTTGWKYKTAGDDWELWVQLPDFFWRSVPDPFACIVCGKHVSDDFNPNVWISRRTKTGGTSGRSVTAHLECMADGERIATAEGITWERRT